MLENVFSPKKIGNVEIPNRFVVPAMVTNICTDDGYITDRYIAYMAEKAKGGFGLLITEDYYCQPYAKGYPKIPGLYEDGQIEGNIKLTNEIHKYGAKIFCQMYHSGRQSSYRANGGAQPVSPSASKDPVTMCLTREITVEEIHEMVKNFGLAAGRAKKAGFDGIELHAAHGYMIAEFLSSYVNKRTDEYGGCFENRVRVLDEIYAAMRENVGPDFPIIIRLSFNEFVVGGRTENESYQLARHVEELGFDAIHVSNGVYASKPTDSIIATMFTKHGLNTERAEEVKKLVNLPIIVANRINDPFMADTIIKMGKADFVSMGRGSLADPDLPNKAKAGKSNTIKYCIGCLEGCQGPNLPGLPTGCVLNPRTNQEYLDDMSPVANPKKVLVIGGGPGGLVAADTAATKGHDVVLYEKESQLGGQFKAAAYPQGKGELSTFPSALRQLLLDKNVPIHMNTEVTEEIIKKEKPDAIIIATGAIPAIPPIKGIESKNVCTAEDILYGRVDISTGPVVVCGGGEVGGETANYMAVTTHDITLLEMQDEILKDMYIMTKWSLNNMIRDNGIKVQVNAKVKEITDHSVIYEQNGETIEIPASQVVSAFGYKAYNPLEEIAKKYTDEVYVIGSAIKAGNVATATKEGYAAALKL